MLSARVIDFGSHNAIQKRSLTEQSKASIRMLRRQLSGCVRTASGPGSPSGQPAWGGGCDRIIYHLSFSIWHLSSSAKSMTFSKAAALCPKWQMKNVKWEMINDPVATARGSDTPS